MRVLPPMVSFLVSPIPVQVCGRRLNGSIFGCRVPTQVSHRGIVSPFDTYEGCDLYHDKEDGIGLSPSLNFHSVTADMRSLKGGTAVAPPTPFHTPSQV
jgi:hypothetical protein